MRHAYGHFGEGVELADRCIREAVNAPVNSLEDPPITQTPQVGPGNVPLHLGREHGPVPCGRAAVERRSW